MSKAEMIETLNRVRGMLLHFSGLVEPETRALVYRTLPEIDAIEALVEKKAK